MDIVKFFLKACLQKLCEFGEMLTISQSNKIASNTDVLRGSSRVPALRTEPKDKFLSHCSQISAGDHMQIIGDPIGAV